MTRGQFEVYHSLQYVTNNVTQFSPQSKSLNMYSFFDAPIDAFGGIGNEFVVGGAFSHANPWDINYAASKGQPTAIDDPFPGAVLQVFPNPAVGDLQIRLENVHGVYLADIEVFDLLGKRLAVEWEGNQSDFTLKRGGIPAGTYFVRLRSDDGILGTTKVVFQ